MPMRKILYLVWSMSIKLWSSNLFFITSITKGCLCINKLLRKDTKNRNLTLCCGGISLESLNSPETT
uniref:Uncharacterized protein n=1 Tax=Picea sitchensis TaxID=3332 RepID=A9NWV7_PICSI|nr:unknown [Picea sitchensis]